MYQELVKEWLRSLHVAGPRYSNAVGEQYAKAFAKWLDERDARQAICTCGLHMIGVVPDDEPCPIHGIPSL